MSLRCLVFSSDEGTAHSIGLVLADLGMEAEYCHVAVEAVQRVTSEVFQIIIADWENPAEAGFLIKTARERKASERPLNLAIVSDDASVPAALQAGANSVLRKPVLANQVRDTLTTARDLLRSRLEAPAPMARAAAAAVSSPAFGPETTPEPTEDNPLRAGEFLQASAPSPGAHFITDSDVQRALDQPPVGEVDALQELTSMAEAVQSAAPAIAPLPKTVPKTAAKTAPQTEERRGLEWYLKNRPAPVAAPAVAPAPEQPEMLGYDETPAYSGDATAEAPPEHAEPQSLEDALAKSRRAQQAESAHPEQEQKNEAALFAYIAGEDPEKKGEPFFARIKPWIGKIALVAALAAVGGFAYLKVPRELWGKNVSMVANYTRHQLHTWLNPQPATTTPAAPASHENFGRAGDEYKLPVAENIPDATTDPSQIRIVPVVDPTVKPANGAANTDPAAAGQTIPAGQTSGDPSQANPAQAPAPGNDGQPVQATPTTGPAVSGPTASAPVATPNIPQASAQPAHNDALAVATPTPAQVAPIQTQQPQQIQAQPVQAQPVAPQRSNPPPVTTASNAIPSSLKSQMASMTPDAGGNKPVDAALPSIEPVKLPEASARTLLLQQADPAYPDTAKGQKGSVVLQVLIGRDGSVQDAKFMQGSLAFARVAIDAVNQWKFKPYLLNGRPVSVQTLITLSFKPGA